MPDFECTWWPDNWFGYSLTNCCIGHDLTGSDTALFYCLIETLPWWLWWLPVVMLTGLGMFGWIYRAYRRKQS